MRELILIAIVLACPLMMMLMMRGGHGHGGHGGHTEEHGGCGHGHSDASGEPRSNGELRRERDDLDRLIEEREAEEQTPTAVGDGWR